jgi:hypothetical protein
VKVGTDGTQIWAGDGRRFYLAASDLERVDPDRPTVKQVRRG